MKASVFVRLKPEVLDPQGRAVQRALATLGFAGVRDVRVGKLIEIDVDDAGATADLEPRLRKMCDTLLANTVMEDFEVRLEKKP